MIELKGAQRWAKFLSRMLRNFEGIFLGFSITEDELTDELVMVWLKGYAFAYQLRTKAIASISSLETEAKKRAAIAALESSFGKLEDTLDQHGKNTLVRIKDLQKIMDDFWGNLPDPPPLVRNKTLSRWDREIEEECEVAYNELTQRGEVAYNELTQRGKV